MLRPPARLHPACLAALCCTAWILGGCGRDTSSLPARPNLLLVVVDTLRQDHLGCYGYRRFPVSPHIDALAADGLRVDGLTGVSSWTMPSVATLYTGLAPAAHKVMRMTGSQASLPAGFTLAGALRDADYATAGVMSNFLLLRERGFGEGFDLYDDTLARSADPHRGSTAAEVAQRGMDWLQQHQDPDQPWFLMLHFFDPHTSYEDHPDFAFADSDYHGWVRGGLDQATYRQHQGAASEADRKQLDALYAEEVAAVDRAVGQVLAALAEREEMENTLVVVTADHGEELAERGYIGHTRTLYFEQTALPLVMSWPAAGLQGVRQGVWSQRDLCATLLDLCGLPVPTAHGLSRADWLRGIADPPKGPVAFEVDFLPIRAGGAGVVRKRGLIEGQWKYLLDRINGRVELYDRSKDPEERHDLSAASAAAAVRTRLAALLDAQSWYQDE